MTVKRPIDPSHARKLTISKQRLDDRPKLLMLDLIRELGCIQLDPIRRVERTHLLVLWSRLGLFDETELEKLRWDDVLLFEYWAHAASIVLTEDYPIHAVNMMRTRQSPKIKAFMDEHDLHDLRVRMLNKMRKEGALGTNDFENDERLGDPSRWSNKKSVNLLMDRLWTMGEVLPAKREGNQRKWALTEDVLPDWTPRDEYSPFDASYHAVQRAVKGLGVAMDKKHINYHYTRNRYFEYKAVKERLLQDEKLIPVQIGNWDGEWFMHSDDLPLLETIESGDWNGRTTLLSPFDNLICDRDRTELMWDFYFRIEIYVPAKKREYGYYVLPILHHDKLIGRMDMAMDRKTHTLEVTSTYAEDHASADAVSDIRDAVQNLATFLDAQKITFGKTMPKIWKSLPKL